VWFGESSVAAAACCLLFYQVVVQNVVLVVLLLCCCCHQVRSAMKNDFFMYAQQEAMAVGGLGAFAIWLDAELLQVGVLVGCWALGWLRLLLSACLLQSAAVWAQVAWCSARIVIVP
jgi:hypothetical protein